MSKRLIIKELNYDIRYELEGDIDNAIEVLTRYKTDNQTADSRLYLSVNSGYDGDAYISLNIERMETDEEYEYRTANETFLNKRVEEQELAQLARLKAKYES